MEIKNEVYRFGDGDISAIYDYYLGAKGWVVYHGLYTSFFKDGDIAYRYAKKHNTNIGLGFVYNYYDSIPIQ